MKFTRIQYNGRKVYRDRTSVRTTWAPGDTNLVSGNDAKMLLRYAEFSAVEGAEPAADDELNAAMSQQESVKAKEDNEKREIENMLMTVESMDKGTLEAYARHYNVELDKRRAVGVLRQEVSTLIEQFGVR